MLRSGGSRPAPTVPPLLLAFVSHHQWVARIPTGVNVSEPIYNYSRTGEQFGNETLPGRVLKLVRNNSARLLLALPQESSRAFVFSATV